MSAPTNPLDLDKLNTAQRDAVTHEGGPLIVLAGPGTGKTFAITARIAYFVAHRGADPRTILALTFTNKAAAEMRERLTGMLGFGPAAAINATTFNAYGQSLLRRFPDLAGLRPNAQLIDDAQRIRLCREIVAEKGLFKFAQATGIDAACDLAMSWINAMFCAGLTSTVARRRIDARLAQLENEDDNEAAGERETARRIAEACRLWDAFDDACRKRGLMAFDHQISEAIRLLQESDAAASIVRTETRHLLVDEFQDVNAAQIDLLSLIAPPSKLAPPDLCVVGDDDQAIYGFRGSDPRAFARFEERWGPETVRTIALEENYRSAEPVLAAANTIITRADRRFDDTKTVRRGDASDAPTEGAAVEAVHLEHHEQAGQVIASMIRAARVDDDVPYSRFAVLANSHKDLESIGSTLTLEGIPVRWSRTPAADADEGVQDVLAWAELALDPAKSWLWRRLMLRAPANLGHAEVAQIDRAWKAARSRDETVNESVAAWALERDNDPQTAAKLGRLIEQHTELAKAALELRADRFIERVIDLTDPVHAELLSGRDRARRIRSLVALLSFARDRQDRLDQPGDIRALLDYLEDARSMSANSFGQPDVLKPVEQSSDPDSDDAANDDNVVTLITAHSSKGLEFDTVFLARVESRGFPQVHKPSGDAVPHWLTEDDDEDRRDEKIEHLDEQRRLFYVALTRAKRRAVLLGKPLKSRKTTSMNFLLELENAVGALNRVTPADEVLANDPLARGEGDELEREIKAWQAEQDRGARLAAARREARRLAAVALDEADRPDLDSDDLASANQRLAEASARLAVIAADGAT
ncbi:MAG: ATP-dependent helicase [Planctomycetota bacterium]